MRLKVSDRDFAKSSFSKNNPKTCVMVAIKPRGIAVRDSKDSGKQTLFFNRDEWNAFVAGVKNGEFDSTSWALRGFTRAGESLPFSFVY